MRLGIRSQLLIAIGVVLALAFAPLFVAVSSLTRAGFAAQAAEHSRALGRAIAGHLGEARRHRGPDELESLLAAQLGAAVGAVGVYDERGALVQRAGDAADALPAEASPEREELREAMGPSGPALVVLVPSERGAVGALVYTDPKATRAAPLLGLLALYMVLLALGLLALSYGLLTRIVIAPIERLRRGAARVAEGAQRSEANAPEPSRRVFGVASGGGRELVDLGESLEDMTGELRAQEAELRRKIMELEEARAELERAQATLVQSERLASVGRLAAGLAHGIGNPISAILGFQELLAEGGLEPEEARDFLARMRRETERVHRVLRDLLDFARPAAGRPTEGEAHGTVHEAVAQVVALLRPQKSFAGVELTTDIASGLPAVALGNERIEQVLVNLLMNAADAVPRDAGRVRLRATAREGGVALSVEDNGGGVNRAVRDRLFEPFATTKEVGRGTGLGLAVCRGLVEAAGGNIALEDGEAGARFVLFLPAART